VSLTIDAAVPRTSGTSDAPSKSAPVTSADFGATLRSFTDIGEEQMKRFSRLNALLRVDRPAYPDRLGCRSWLAW
jgi:hypothetical protein